MVVEYYGDSNIFLWQVCAEMGIILRRKCKAKICIAYIVQPQLLPKRTRINCKSTCFLPHPLPTQWIPL